MPRTMNPNLPTAEEWQEATVPLDRNKIEALIWRLQDFEKAYLDSNAPPATFEDLGILWTYASYLRLDGEELIGFADRIEELLHTVDMVRLNQERPREDDDA